MLRPDLLYFGIILIVLGLVLFYFNMKIAKIGAKNRHVGLELFKPRIDLEKRAKRVITYNFALNLYRICILMVATVLIIYGLHSIYLFFEVFNLFLFSV